MSSFSCPHYNERDGTCRRVTDDCVPGRTGCVLRNNSKFAVPVEERIRQKALEQLERSSDSESE